MFFCPCDSPSPFSLFSCESALPDQVCLYWDSSWTTLVRVGASWHIWYGMRSSCLFQDGLSGGNRSASETRGEGVVGLLTTNKKQDENLWKKMINGILKQILTRRGQELNSFTWMAKGSCSSLGAREVRHIWCLATAWKWEDCHGTRRMSGKSSSVCCQVSSISPAGTWQTSGSQGALKKILLVFLMKYFHFKGMIKWEIVCETSCKVFTFSWFLSKNDICYSSCWTHNWARSKELLIYIFI